MPDKTRRPRESRTPRGKTDWAALDAMTDEAAQAAALADPDAPPTPAGRPPHRMARAKHVRLGLRLSQAEFAQRFHIPEDTLKGWERHEIEPDAVARAFLDAIAADPAGVAAALARARPQAAE